MLKEALFKFSRKSKYIGNIFEFDDTGVLFRLCTFDQSFDENDKELLKRNMIAVESDHEWLTNHYVNYLSFNLDWDINKISIWADGPGKGSAIEGATRQHKCF